MAHQRQRLQHGRLHPGTPPQEPHLCAALPAHHGQIRRRQTGERTAQTPQNQSRCGGKVQKDCILQSDICYLCKLKK